MFINSLYNAVTSNVPWEHIKLSNCLTALQIQEVEKSEINCGTRVFDGTRSGSNTEKDLNHSCREYLTKQSIEKYPELYNLIVEMQSQECVELIKSLLKDSRDYSNAYVRVEILKDTDGFWLQPHCDIPEKLTSGLIYVNTNNESINLGTDLYDTDLNLVSTLDFINNTGYLFNGPGKWHGFEKKHIKKVRMGLQINYVIFETDWPC